MSYFKLIPELREELKLDRCEWMLLCLIISYPKVTLSNKRIGEILGYGETNIKLSLQNLVRRGLVKLVAVGGGANAKIAVDKDQYDFYLGKSN